MGGSAKILRLLTRWVGGSKKGQKHAYVIFEWSLKPKAVLKDPDNAFCHRRKLPPKKFQSRPFGGGIFNL